MFCSIAFSYGRNRSSFPQMVRLYVASGSGGKIVFLHQNGRPSILVEMVALVLVKNDLYGQNGKDMTIIIFHVRVL